ncbi:hypothetical protein RUMOBE_00149 [Blautia obeum ATCC 29174]|uniref:Uncharacterized protein n=1 Tax=Blautia obeum ATCC 29174 TaxID=411459 RepID=A5ZMD3_9FIRM|nr:hypothetical protein RUMOBE_00149 [Blautia obeum ATCC 29174]
MYHKLYSSIISCFFVVTYFELMFSCYLFNYT